MSSVFVTMSFLALLGASCQAPEPDEAVPPTPAGLPEAGGGEDADVVVPATDADADASSVPPFPAAPKEIANACSRRADVAVAGLFASDPDQRGAQRSYFARACIVDAVAPGSTITAADIENCTAALIGRNTCLQYPPGECVPRVGTLPSGAKCVSGHQCDSGACSRGASCGVCVAAQALGELCTGRDCAPGLICRPLKKGSRGCSSPNCIPAEARCEVPQRDTEVFASNAELGLIGDACVTDYGCGSGLVCLEGKCEGGKVGSACGISSRTFCEPGLTCHPSTKICVEGTAELGQSCDASNPCRGNGYCSSGATPVCMPLAPLGGSCNSLSCAPGARGEQTWCDITTRVCVLQTRPLDGDLWCRAASAPACAPCRVKQVGNSSGSGNGTYGTIQAGEPLCDKAAMCAITKCYFKQGCVGTCEITDPYWCSRQ